MKDTHLIIAAVVLAFGACWMQAAAVYSDERYDGFGDPIETHVSAQDAAIPASVALFN